MVPGTALGVLVGDLAYTWLAVRLRQRTGRDDVTAMPFGIDTPTLFAMVFGVLGPVMTATGDPVLAWKVGMAATLAIGLAKVGLAFGGDWARRVVPRAALLGSIGGVAILLIAFLPTLKILRDPLVGLVALGVLLLGLFGGVRMPVGLPGAFAAVLAGTALFWVRAWLGSGHDGEPPVATVLAALCGGVIQNTPYIGHPAYKAMGARAGYTLATGLVIGGGAAAGALSLLVAVLPEAAIAPILVFIGLEITAQGFLASPPRHGAAVALAFVPTAAALVLIEAGGLLSAAGVSPARLTGEAALTHQTLLVLGNGFILTGVVWGWALVTIIDRHFAMTGVLFSFASAAALFGVIHSPEPSGALFWPWAPPSVLPARLAGAYGVLAAICWLATTAARNGAKRRISA